MTTIPLVVLLLLLALMLPVVPRGTAANVSFTLQADFRGWDFGLPGGSNPALTANAGDMITVSIDWVNDIHNWALYPPGTTPDQVSLSSPNAIARTADVDITSPTASVTFPINTPGTYEYYCEYHRFSMHGQLVILTPATAPQAAIAAPTAGTSWTGGTSHDIRFDLVDDGPTSSLTAWVNYSFNADASGGTIATLSPPGPNPVTVPWSVPSIDATDVIVNVTVTDGTGAFGYDDAGPIEIDSTAPSVTSRIPNPGASGVSRNTQIVVGWSEPMNRLATQSSGAFALEDVPNVWVAGTASWSGDSRTITFTPTAPLDPLTTYRVHVNTSARDDSDPGNAPLALGTWTFVTGSAVDITAPSVSDVRATPSTQVTGGSVNITATIRDETAVTSVNVRIVGPSFDQTVAMTRFNATTWYLEGTYDAMGSYSFTISAADQAGNIGSGSGSFTIAPLTGPPPLAFDAVVIGGILVAILVLAALTLLFARRRRRGPAP